MRTSPSLRAFAAVAVLGLLLSVSSVEAVSDSGWGTAQVIEADEPGVSMLPQVAVDGSGNGVVVWHQWDDSHKSIWSSRYVAGTGWGMPQHLDTGSGSDVSGPRVAISGSGNGIAVWSQRDGFIPSIWSSRYVVGIGWGTAQLIESISGNAQNPQVAVDGSGNAIAVWSQREGSYDSIWSNRYADGTGWSGAQLVESNSEDAWIPHVAVDGSGNAVLVWLQWDGVDLSIWSNRYVVGAGWGTAQLIETETGGADSPKVAVDGSGNAIAVWQQYDGTRLSIRSNRYVVGAGWGTAQRIDSNNREDVSEMAYGGPQVAVDSSGNAIAVWGQYDGTRVNVWSNRCTASAGWGVAQLIETEPGEVRDPQVAVGGEGNGTVVWLQHDGVTNKVWANRYVAGEGWQTAQVIDSGPGAASGPHVAVDALGNSVAVWGLSEIWYNRYAANLGNSDADDTGGVGELDSVLMIVASIVATLAVVISVMYLRLRRKRSRASRVPSKEEKPPPKT